MADLVIIKRCYATGSVTGRGSLGGFVGSNGSFISECFATGDVTGTDCVAGGFVGQNNGGGILDCYARGDVTVTHICFLAGTSINMSDGSLKPIEQVIIGDDVLLGGRVDKVYKHQADKYMKINNLQVTPEHPLLSSGKWVRANMLCVGDFLTDRNGKPVKITSMSVVNEEVDVYNLTVAKHVYVASGYIVHNK